MNGRMDGWMEITKKAGTQWSMLWVITAILKYDVCDVTLIVYPHRTSLKNMPGHGGNRTYATFGILAQCSAI